MPSDGVPRVLRLWDSGLLPAAEHIAWDRGLLELRAADRIPDTLRFLRFNDCALVGAHQDARAELDIARCKSRGVEIQRRITGGGAICLDPKQLGWELVVQARALGAAGLESIAARLCEAVAGGLSTLGIDARFRPRNDIEVDGRKISGTGGVREGNALLFQGTLLVDFDIAAMLEVLRIPDEKLRDKAVASARERVTCLTRLLGSPPGQETLKQVIAQALAKLLNARLAPAEPDAFERAYQSRVLAEIASPEWLWGVHLAQPHRGRATHACQGGLLHAAVDLDGTHARLRQVWLSGDFFISPARTIPDLEAALKGCALDRIEDELERFFRTREVDMPGLTPADFRVALTQAIHG